jgi:hypothetical protein
VPEQARNRAATNQEHHGPGREQEAEETKHELHGSRPIVAPAPCRGIASNAIIHWRFL